MITRMRTALLSAVLCVAVTSCAMPPAQYARDGHELGRHIVTHAVTARISVFERAGRLVANVKVENHFWDQVCLSAEVLGMVALQLDPRALTLLRVGGDVLELANPDAVVGFYEGHYSDRVCLNPGDSVSASVDLVDSFGPVFREGDRYKVTYDTSGDSQANPPAANLWESDVGVGIGGGIYIFEVPEGYRPSEP